MSDHLPSSKTSSGTAWILGSAFLACAAFLFRYGYGFGFSDQDEFLPLVLRLMDDGLFTRDAFVQMQSGAWSIRLPMAALVALASQLLPVWFSVFLLHVMTGIGSGWALGRLVHRIFRSRWATLAAVVAAVAVTSRWNPGGNDVLHGMLVPSSVAWCFSLWALERVHARSFVTAGVLSALAMIVHPLVGLQAGGILLLVHLSLPERTWSGLWQQALPFLAIAFPLVWILIDLGSASIGTAGGLDASTILTQLRSPHHYLPASFPALSWVQLGVLVLGALAMLRWNPASRVPTSSGEESSGSVPLDRISVSDRDFLLRLILVPVGVLLASLAVTWWPFTWDTALRLQPWALSPLVRVMATAILTATLARFLLGVDGIAAKPASESDPDSLPAIPASVLLLLLGATALLFTLSSLGPDIRGQNHPDADLHRWAAANTDTSAVFIVPPSMTGFQFGARRAQYVSFKSFPFEPGPTLLWWERLQRFAPVDDWQPGGVPLLARLDSAWAAQDLSAMRNTLEVEPVDFLIRPADDPAEWSRFVEPQWCDGEWCVYWAGRILRTPTTPSTQ